MKQFLKEYFPFLLLLLAWIALGIVAKPASYILIVVSVFLLWQKQELTKVLLGLLLILLLSDNLKGTLSFAQEAKSFYMLLIGALFILSSKRINPKSKVLIIFTPFIIYSFLVLINAGNNIVVGLQKTISYSILLMAIPTILISEVEKKGKRILIDFVYLSFFILTVGLILKFIDPSFVTRAGRFCGLMGNPNGLGIYVLLYYLFFRLANYFNPDGFSRQEKVFIYILIIYNLILCSSRTAMGGVIFFFIAEKLFKVSSFIAIIALVVGMFFFQYLFIFLPEIISYLNLEEYFRLQTLEEGSGRYIAWEFAWQKIQDNFFWGGGFGYDEYNMRPNYAMLAKLGHLGGVHNSYISMWFDFGLIGVIVYFRSFFLSFIKAHKKHLIALPLMFTCMISMTFESWLVASLNPYTIQVFMMLAVLLYLPKPNQTDNLSDEESMA